MTSTELTQWKANPLRAAVPAVAIDGTRLFANYVGNVFALDLAGGKMLWRSASFHHLEVSAMQDQARMLDASRFAVVASGDYVWSLGRDLKDQNYLAPFRLSGRRAESGQVVWQSTDLPEYAGIDIVGPPLLVGGKLFIAGKTQASPQHQGQPQQAVLAIQPHDGKVLWKTDVGTFRQGQQYYYYGNREPTPQPQLVFRAGALYVDTHVGVLARLDAESGALDWGYGYQTDAAQGQGRFFFVDSYQSQAPTTGASAPVQAGESLLIKGMQSGRLYAIEPNRMKVTWDRPIAKSSRLLGTDDRALILGGPEISAMDLKTRALLWATPVPDGSLNGRVLVRPDGIWQLTPRGIFEIDPGSGIVRRIFRGNDLGAVGGDLFLTDRLLVAVSNRTISAYPRRKDPAEVSDVDDPTTTKVRASND